jgi:hypothetical protein
MFGAGGRDGIVHQFRGAGMKRNSRLLWPGLCLLALAGLAGCNKPTPPQPTETAEVAWFEDITQEVGLDFTHDAGVADEVYFMPQITGSGSALFDFDGDGRLDILLLNNAGPKGRPNQLFKQMPDGTFKNVSKGSGLDFSGYCQGVAIGDVNNDGLPDVLITEYGGVRLFLNNGDGTFADVTVQAGLTNPLWATSAAFVDYNRDGWLDLVVVNYLKYEPLKQCYLPDANRDYCAPATFVGTVTKLYRNLGKQPQGKERNVCFEDVTIPSGLAQHSGPGLGVICADFNGDGWPDIFIANDGKPNHLWINQKNGTFQEEAVLRGVAYNAMGKAEANMGIAWGDVDGDGLQDLFVTHLNIETNTLWKQAQRGQFQDKTSTTGLHHPITRATGFGTVLSDFDCDGALDVAIVNGAVSRTSPSESGANAFWSQYYQRNQLFANDGTGKFRDLSSANAGTKGLCGYGNIGRGLAVGDVANNGTQWLLATSVAGPARLYRNTVPNRGHWVVIRAFDPALKRDALGAEVTLRAGQRTWVRTVQASAGYLSSNDPRAHFGLGKVDHLDSIHVLWPDGKEETFPPSALDRHLELRKGEGKAANTATGPGK